MASEPRVEVVGDPVKPQMQLPRRRNPWVLAAAAGARALPIARRRGGGGARAYDILGGAGPAALGDEALPRGVDRTYYIAADPVDWDYAPAGRNLCKGIPFTEDEQLYITAGAGTKYKKALFRQYTDDTFKVRNAMKWRNGDPHAGMAARGAAFTQPGARCRSARACGAGAAQLAGSSAASRGAARRQPPRRARGGRRRAPRTRRAVDSRWRLQCPERMRQ